MTRLLLIAAAALAAALAGCGSSSSSSSSSSPPTTTSAGGGAVVKMQNIQFNPKTITVKVGHKVTWENFDNVDHNVTATSGASFKSKDFGHGGTFSFTPTKAGTISYTCTIHPGMDGTLNVTK